MGAAACFDAAEYLLKKRNQLVRLRNDRYMALPCGIPLEIELFSYSWMLSFLMPIGAAP